MTHRRSFLKNSAFTAGALAFPSIVPSSVFGQDSPSKRVNLALIGCGSRMSALGLRGFAKNDGARIVATVDPFKSKREDFAQKLNKQYGGNYCKPVEDYREVLANKHIDGIVIATADHWHVPIAIAAARAGKDMYVEKPLTVALEWGKILRKELAKNNCIFQYGTQQRSTLGARTAMELIWNGHIGDIQRVDVSAPSLAADKRTPIGNDPLPKDFNYDLWLGPAPKKPYSKDRCSNHGSWHCYDYALGFIAGWGAHPLDILQWGMQSDDTCPVEYEGTGFAPENDLYNTLRTWDIQMKYANGIPVRFMDTATAKPVIGKYHSRLRGDNTVFHGTDGWVCYSRSVCYLSKGGKYVNTSTIDLSGSKKKPYLSTSQHGNFIDCMKSRKETINPFESAIRSDTISHLSNIAARTGRKLSFDAKKEIIVGDEKANALLNRKMRAPYEIS
jgi:predicted dehydrogenase